MSSYNQFSIEPIESAIESLWLNLCADKDYVDKALKVYQKQASAFPEGLSEIYFNPWLVNSYAGLSDYERVLGESDPLAEVIANGYFSLFKVFRNKQYLIFEDIFTKRQYAVLAEPYAEQFTGDHLHLAYIYTLHGNHWVAGEHWTISADHQTSIVKEVLKQYQSAKSLGAYTVEGFVRSTPLLLFWMIETYRTLEEEDLVEEAYFVYEVICALENPTGFDAFLKTPNVTQSDIEGVFTLKIDEALPIDFTLEGKRLIFDCASEEDAQTLQYWLEGEGQAFNLIFVEVRVTSLEDLLGEPTTTADETP